MTKKLVASVGEDECVLNVGFICTKTHEIPSKRHEDNPSNATEPIYESSFNWAEIVINGEGFLLPNDYVKKHKVQQQLQLIIDEQAVELFEKD
jgi:hypothetical protein